MPRTRWDGYERFCPFARALDVVGERWTLVIIHSLLAGPARYTDLKAGLPGIGTNVLSDRLKKLEAVGVVRRTLGEVGDGVRYELSERGHALEPAMAELRRWGADELLAAADEQRVFDQSYAIPEELDFNETYEWRIDDTAFTLSIESRQLVQHSGHATAPAVIVTTTMEFMRQWAAGETNWTSGRIDGVVAVDGPEDAWNRMLVATNYPGRPADLTDQMVTAAASRRRRTDQS